MANRVFSIRADFKRDLVKLRAESRSARGTKYCVGSSAVNLGGLDKATRRQSLETAVSKLLQPNVK